MGNRCFPQVVASQVTSRGSLGKTFGNFVPIDNALGQQAAALAAEHQIRGCDALYAGLAEGRGATLITLDRQQRERVPSQLEAHTPVEALTILSQGN